MYRNQLRSKHKFTIIAYLISYIFHDFYWFCRPVQVNYTRQIEGQFEPFELSIIHIIKSLIGHLTHHIIITSRFIHNAISLSQCRRLPYAFCTRPPTLYSILAQSLPVFSQQFYTATRVNCSDWYLVDLILPKIRVQGWKSDKQKRQKKMKGKEMKSLYNMPFLLPRRQSPLTIKIGYQLMISCLSIRPTLKAHHGTNPTEARLSRVQPLKLC